MNYPTDIYGYDGWGRIHQGHGLDLAALAADWREDTGTEAPALRVEEVHLVYRPRIKWCGRFDDGCELEGEWHGHWSGVQANDNPDTKFTIVHKARKTVSA